MPTRVEEMASEMEARRLAQDVALAVQAALLFQTAPSAGEFRAIYGQMGGGLIPVEEAAIVNGLEVDEQVMKGQWLKLPDAVKHP